MISTATWMLGLVKWVTEAARGLGWGQHWKKHMGEREEAVSIRRPGQAFQLQMRRRPSGEGRKGTRSQWEQVPCKPLLGQILSRSIHLSTPLLSIPWSLPFKYHWVNSKRWMHSWSIRRGGGKRDKSPEALKGFRESVWVSYFLLVYHVCVKPRFLNWSSYLATYTLKASFFNVGKNRRSNRIMSIHFSLLYKLQQKNYWQSVGAVKLKTISCLLRKVGFFNAIWSTLPETLVTFVIFLI